MKILIVSDFILHSRGFLTRAINEATNTAKMVGAINVAYDPAKEWTKLKFGVYPNEVGLQIFDRAAGEAITTAFNSKLNQLADAFRGLPGYVGHPDDPNWAKKNPGVRPEAIARIREMKVEEDGLSFRTAYNDRGKALTQGDAPAFDSFSPHWGMVETTYKGRKAFRPVELYSIGFTNHPNIPGSYIGLNEALPTEEFPVMKKHIIALLAALGRPVADAAAVTDEQLATAVNEAVAPAQAAITAVNELVTTKTALTAAQAEVTTIKGQLATSATQLTTATNEATTAKASLIAERKSRADLVLVAAINEGRITAAQRVEWEGKLLADGADFTTVSGEISKLKKAINTKTQTEGLGARRGAVSPESSKRISAVNEAVNAEMEASKCDRSTAYLAVQKKKPELFTATNA